MKDKNRKKQLEEMMKDLSDYEKKKLEAYNSAFPNEDLTILLETVKEDSKNKAIQEKNRIKNTEMYNREELKEKYYQKYYNKYRDKLTYEDCKTIVSIFYTNDNPKELLAIEPQELIKKYA